MQKFPTGREKVAGNPLLDRRMMEGRLFPGNSHLPVALHPKKFNLICQEIEFQKNSPY
jgi:hypothetical protein